MRLPRRRGLAIAGGNVPLHHVVRFDLQSVEVIEISGNVVLGVLTVIGQSAKQEDLVPDACEAVAQAGAGRGPILRVLGPQLLPLPPRGL